MKIQDVMTRQVATAHPDHTLSEAARLMRQRDCGFLPITNGATGGLDGVITDRDICMAALGHDLPLTRIRIGEAMTHAVRACGEHADVSVAHALMREHHVRRLPVTNAEGRLVGVVSLDDLARLSRRKLLGQARAEVAETLGVVGRSYLRE